jgi:hypothetical protein
VFLDGGLFERQITGIKKATATAVAKRDVNLKEQQNVRTTEHTGGNNYIRFDDQRQCQAPGLTGH